MGLLGFLSSPTERKKEGVQRKIAAKNPERATKVVTVGDGEGGLHKKFVQHVGGKNLAILFFGSLLVWWGFAHTNISPAAVGATSWGFWLPCLVLWGMAHALIAVNSKKFDDAAKGLAGVLHKIVLATVFFAFIVLPVWNWGGVGQNGGKPPLAYGCQFSSTEVRQCLVTEDGVIMSTRESMRTGEFEFCYVKPKTARLESKLIGPNTLEVKSIDGSFSLTHKMIRRDLLVNGQCPAQLS